MRGQVTRRGRLREAVTAAAVALVVVALAGQPGAEPASRPLSVAVSEADLEAIVKVVAGADVRTFSLFRGCILRDGLEVDAAARERLAGVDVIVWSGFFNESRAIHSWLEAIPADRRARLGRPAWIDVSRNAKRINVPVSECDGYLDLQFMPGDPFFWLNPENGAVIATNLAEELGRLRPERRESYLANAASYARELGTHIERWKAELKPLEGLRVFSVQCGWQNFAQLGGPKFLSCRQGPATSKTPESLAAQLADLQLDIILIDPNTPPGYAEACQRRTKAKILVVPSSLADLAGAMTYEALFDNLVTTLARAAGPR